MMRFAIYSILVLSLLSSINSAEAEQVLYQYRTFSIYDGKFGPIALFQQRLKQALAKCESSQTLVPDGDFGPGTRKAIIAVTRCSEIDSALSVESPARQGAITDTLWQLVVPDQEIPNVSKRAASLKLTFERTDYDKMQWNFCQNTPFYDPENGKNICFSNDQSAFLTWGPNGATAGHGREVQAILKLFLNSGESRREAMFKDAFGDEAKAVKRMMKMQKTPNDKKHGSLETYLCSVWMKKDQRDAWREGFRKLGVHKELQDAYRLLYSAQNFDGGKIQSFYQAWQSPQFDLPVSEIDHGFFVDRSAHMSIDKSLLIDALNEMKNGYQGSWPPPPAEVRRHVSLSVIPRYRRQDRLGRDIAFYIQQISFDKLSEKEQIAWRKRDSRNSSDVGLSDERFMTVYSPTAYIKHPEPTGHTDIDETCPVAVLAPERPK